VAYIDIDVHHGDGVQWMFYNDPSILTCSIHEEGRTLFPGTGGVEESGANFTSFNVPLQARTSGDVWLQAFLRTIPLAVEAFGAEAIVLQLGTDTHVLDPLGHIRCIQQDWLGAVTEVGSWNLPTVAVGGGGYNLQTVPRMWASACLTLGGLEFEDKIPADLTTRWQMPTFADHQARETNVGSEHAEKVVRWLHEEHLPILRSGLA
jgi:acetoin utilization protein AcuC